MTAVDPASLTILGGAIVGLSHFGKGLAERLLGPAADAVGRHLGEGVAARLTNNRNATINRAGEMLAEAGQEPSAVPLPILIPLLQAAALEEEAEMRERWAALLARAASGDEDAVDPLYVTLLTQLSPLAARCLDMAWQLHLDIMYSNGSRTEWGPTEVEIAERLGIVAEPWVYRAIDGLVSLGILHRDQVRVIDANTVEKAKRGFRPTAIGAGFVKACRPLRQDYE